MDDFCGIFRNMEFPNQRRSEFYFTPMSMDWKDYFWVQMRSKELDIAIYSCFEKSRSGNKTYKSDPFS